MHLSSSLPATGTAHSLLRGFQSLSRPREAMGYVGAVLRLALVLGAFLACFFGNIGSAEARAIPMCSDLAESVSAPPPLFAADDAEATPDCAQEKTVWLSSSAPTKQESELVNGHSTLKLSATFTSEQIMAVPQLFEAIDRTPADQSTGDACVTRISRPPASC